ncbi:helix-turn-helix transcriptional regulator [Rubellimicrobium aerolatum]|uniref:Helix-turn-helix transcriptional regulator n=1 Tax=Rubellimicrobium aerolatum TaxID=490979 RepID=A0ABW0SBU7_9RHOB|nr:HTH domain-containing protein [Rubellimicrobium aerolatum]MBP1805902.1 putative DNA-binding transcriptional regulator YafY [Rubellimicrobium aerolatum]
MPPRTDRLLDLVRLLSDGRLHRAEDLARRLRVSPRTIYRDMDTLIASGVPIAGERGLGYAATSPVTLPPLNLSLPELEALHLGLAVVGEAGDEELKEAARSLSAKIDAVLPEDRSAPQVAFGFATHAFAEASRGFRHMPVIRAAIRARQKLRLHLPPATPPRRIVRPLRLDYWGRVWTVTCWDETGGGFDLHRVDLIEEVTALPQLFVDEPGRTLADYQATLG